MIRKQKNNAAQIGTTLTWFVAFLVIFFIMLLFVASTIILSKAKGIEVNSEPVKYISEELKLQRALITFLNTPIEFNGEKMQIKELIKKWDALESERKNIEPILKQDLDQQLPKYFFGINGIGEDHDALLSFEKEPEVVSTASEKQIYSIYLVSDKGILKISLSFSKFEGVPGL